jgi:type IV secretory pathway protease TraF
MVEVSSSGISVNGSLIPNNLPQFEDSIRRTLSAWPVGLYRVAPGSVWVASFYNPLIIPAVSHGRYFGPIQLKNIKNRLRPLWTGD